jgi:predicted glutamine amidotransferase
MFFFVLREKKNTTNYPILTIFLFSVTDRTFLTVCANTSSKCIMAHIRAASRPPVVPTNNHPFVFGRHSFMHNGTVTDFPKIVSFFFISLVYQALLTI